MQYPVTEGVYPSRNPDINLYPSLLTGRLTIHTEALELDTVETVTGAKPYSGCFFRRTVNIRLTLYP